MIAFFYMCFWRYFGLSGLSDLAGLLGLLDELSDESLPGNDFFILDIPSSTVWQDPNRSGSNRNIKHGISFFILASVKCVFSNVPDYTP